MPTHTRVRFDVSRESANNPREKKSQKLKQLKVKSRKLVATKGRPLSALAGEYREMGIFRQGMRSHKLLRIMIKLRNLSY